MLLTFSRFLLVFLAGASISFASFSASSTEQETRVKVLPFITISLAEVALEVEYAHTFEQRARGLMFRQSLCAQCGMLFKFSSQKKASMWMQDTFIALDVAFIRADGTITDIKAMQPHDLTSVGASQAVLYALEMNQGWFAENGIQVGDKMRLSGLQTKD